MALDIDQLIADIKNTATDILNKDVETVRGFSNRQLSGIANQTALISMGIATGQITEATRDFFLDQLVELARNFANTLVGLTVVTIRSEEHTSELQSLAYLVCRLLLEKKKKKKI